MSVLFYGVGLILVAFFIHLIIWKIHLPKNHTKVLLQIFMGALITGVFILWRFSSYIIFFGVSTPKNVFGYLQLFLFFVSLMLAYVVTYSALEVDSPSLLMMMQIAQAGNSGLDKDIFEWKMGDDILVIPRLEDLVLGEMVCFDGKAYRLSPKGMLMARIFTGYRKLFNKEKGG